MKEHAYGLKEHACGLKMRWPRGRKLQDRRKGKAARHAVADEHVVKTGSIPLSSKDTISTQLAMEDEVVVGAAVAAAWAAARGFTAC